MTRRQTERTISCVGALTAAAAVAGSVYGLSGAAGIPREWLDGSPFADYRLPSLILGIVVGGSSAAAVAVRRGSDRAGPATVTAAVMLTGWVAAQVSIIGYRSFLQPMMGAVGVSPVGGSTLCGRSFA